jgi:DUF1016 N-terminal domain
LQINDVSVLSQIGAHLSTSKTNKAVSVSATADAESALYASIRALVAAARITIAHGVDLVQVHTNFSIGRHIVEFEQGGAGRAEYGKQVLKQLASRLTANLAAVFH